MAIKTKGNVYLEMDTATSGGPTFTRVPGVFSNDGGGTTTERVDVTDFDTVGNSREYISGLSEEQPLSFELHYQPGNAVQEAIRAANAAGTTKTFRLVFGEAHNSNPETYTFSAFVSSYGVPRGPIEGKLSVPFELQPAAAGAWAKAD